jgi:hypothetical protein
MPLTAELQKKLSPPSYLLNSLIETGQDIDAHPPTSRDLAFVHSVLCQVGLPRSRVKGKDGQPSTSFLRQSGAAWLHVQAGYLDLGDGPVLQCVPYGPLPRLALAWITTFIKRHKQQEVPLGDSAYEFLHSMGLNNAGMRYAMLEKQINALAACRLQFGFHGRTFNGEPVEQFDAWVRKRRTINQRSMWPGRMIVSANFANSVIDGNVVPVDLRALMELPGALAMDIYCWLAQRLWWIEGRGVTVHWKPLREQFAQEYGGKDADKDFKKEFLPALDKVLEVYPKANVKKLRGGLLLLPSPPPVPKL